MAKFTEWYAVELDGFLKGRLPDVQRFEAIKEVSNHFSEHVDELVERGMDPIEAEKAAIKSFGNPRAAAVNLLSGGKRSMFGSGLYSLAALGLMVSIIASAVGFQFYNLKLAPYSRQDFLVNGALIFGAAGVCAVLAGFLSRKVQLGKLAAGWVLGIVGSFGYLTLGPERHFANVDPANLSTQKAKWESRHESTVKLTKLYGSIHHAVSQDYSTYRYNDESVNTINRPAAIEKIKTLAPQMLALNTPYVRTTGSLTQGYLVPVSSTASYNYLYIRRYGGQSWQDAIVADTGESFPWKSVSLKYVKSGDEAIQGWQNFASNNWDFEQIGREQEGFLREVDEHSKKSRLELAGSTMLTLSGASLLYLAIFAVLSWIVGRIPDLTVYATFRRKLA